MLCAICGEPTELVYDVLGRQTSLCYKHRHLWEELGPLASMIAFALEAIDVKRAAEAQERKREFFQHHHEDTFERVLDAIGGQEPEGLRAVAKHLLDLAAILSHQDPHRGPGMGGGGGSGGGVVVVKAKSTLPLGTVIKASGERVMVRTANLDDVRIDCPCRAGIRSPRPSLVAAFLEEHRAHADVIEDRVSDDGMRCMAGPKPAPVRRPL